MPRMILIQTTVNPVSNAQADTYLGVAIETCIGLGLMILWIVFLLLGAGVGGIGVWVGVGAPTALIDTGNTKSYAATWNKQWLLETL